MDNNKLFSDEIDKIIDPENKGINGQKVEKSTVVTRNKDGNISVKVFPFIPCQKESVTIKQDENGNIEVDGIIQKIRDEY